MDNFLYHHSKYKLGLSSFLMGNGLCFTTALLQQRQWTAFTIGETRECSPQLVGIGIKISFAVDAKVFHQESKSLNQATSQRLRWSKGRFHVARHLGLNLLIKGIKQRNWLFADASLPLIFPNYSLLVSLTALFLAASVLMPSSFFHNLLISLALAMLCSQIMLFIAGTYLSGSYWQVFKAALYAPAFLLWKTIIDILSITGIYKGSKWVRTKRHLGA